MDKYKQSFPLCNLQATRIPSYSDDSSCGFTVGSLWVFGGVIFSCKISSIDSAIWSSTAPFTETITGDGNTANDTRIIVHNKNNSTPSVQLWYEYEAGKWRQLDVTQGITTETSTPNQLLLNLLAYEGNQTSNKYSIIVQ